MHNQPVILSFGNVTYHVVRRPAVLCGGGSLEDTEIPALRSHVMEIAQRGQKGALNKQASDISHFIHSVGATLASQVST